MTVTPRRFRTRSTEPEAALVHRQMGGEHGARPRRPFRVGVRSHTHELVLVLQRPKTKQGSDDCVDTSYRVRRRGRGDEIESGRVGDPNGRAETVSLSVEGQDEYG